ncbi:MAG: hypothetical protein R3C10_10705 [Pirellulales bacterium]
MNGRCAAGRFSFGFCGLLVTWCAATAAVADDVEVTAYLPAGGRVGTSCDVTVSDKFARWPLQVWTDTPALVMTAGDEKGALHVEIAPDAVPGTHYFRLYDAQGRRGSARLSWARMPRSAKPSRTTDAAMRSRSAMNRR